MSNDSRKQPDRYDVTGNIVAEYVDEAQSVLVNLLGITSREQLELAEEEALARAYEQLLSDVRTDTPLRNDLIYHVHAVIFGEIYGWAGRLRTVTISKPGIIWPPPPFLSQSMDEFERPDGTSISSRPAKRSGRTTVRWKR